MTTIKGAIARLRAALRRPALLPHWRAVLKRAWSIRLDMLGIALSAAEFGVNAMMSSPPLSRGVFTLVGMAITALSMSVRLLKQRNLSGKTDR